MLMRRSYYVLLAVALVFVFGGSLLAWSIQTSGGTVEVRDVRFAASNGTMMSGLLYIPPGVTNENPAPGILAIHGYINTRETQSPFAIEFSRRGYVVLALDQTGHGYSDPPAFNLGFGGPPGLAYLRSLDIVDPDNIGLEGHSMGGWASLIATSVYPDGYRSIVIEGSSTGTFGAPEGTPELPRNIAVVFSVWDEFSELMWGVPTADQINNTEKLQTLFGTDAPVEAQTLYGSIEDGTGRMLYQPRTTHPGDHLNSEAVGNAIEWFQMTLEGGNGLAPADQVWMWKEIGTLIALIGMVLFIFPFGMIVLQAPFFREVVQPLPESRAMGGVGRWIAYVLLMVIPILTYFWAQNQAGQWFETSPWLAQNLTTGIATWAVLNGLITLVLFLVWHFTSARSAGATAQHYGVSTTLRLLVKAFLLSAVVVFGAYMLLALVDFLFKTDFRFWVVAVRPLTSLQFRIFLGYLPFFVIFFLILGLALHGQLRLTQSDGKPVSFARAALKNVGLLVVGFIVLLLVQYLPLMAGQPLPLGEPLLTIVAFQFVPLLTIAGLISTFFFRVTGRIYTGAFVNAILITWIIVAAQATHYPF